MALINKTYYTYKDVTIMPAVISSVEHRSECSPFYDDGMLPLFTSPMNTVVGSDNFNLFEKEKINAILPRTEEIKIRLDNSSKGKWSAYSLGEFEKYFCNKDKKIRFISKIRALIDVANGHMKKIFDLVSASKEIYGGDIEIMTGNIANPSTYVKCADAGIDYVRVGIGSGCGCLSSSNTGVHVPMASLISQISYCKKNVNNPPKIIADGGVRNYRDVIKALALGADYVMIGSVFASMLESSAKKTCDGKDWTDFIKIPLWTSLKDIENIRKETDGWVGTYNGKEVKLGNISAIFYGMASREGQIALYGEKKKTSEGLLKTLPVKYTMHTWVENFIDYLRSAMSYTNALTLNDFTNNTNLIVNSYNSVIAVND